jgi:hypothetical protein
LQLEPAVTSHLQLINQESHNRELLWTWISILKCLNALKASLLVNVLRIVRFQPTIAFGVKQLDDRPVHVGFLVNKMAPVQVCLRVLRFSPGTVISSMLHTILSQNIPNLSNWRLW